MTSPVRRRDAAATRQLLLEAARRRFAADGYAATSVRDIATDAGVNVALISRYFESKEGLFRACLRGTVDDLKQSVFENLPLEDAPRMLAEKMAISQPKEANQLLLLLRSSGDETAERIRLDTLGSLARRLAAAAGSEPDDPKVLLNAQIVLATALGAVILRSAGLQPLAAADSDQLAEPLEKVISVLLPKT
ncbi:AcrR family transcriptional regulator [Actinoplanes lutulentus]|uniref:TetR family transcriptional regulator n=1 Tax=Actinoplanes lutulentus TaxID=1287878 RepID=A0A327Z2K9_9ACTN|nr:TetR/AcrR family transcriptional regulator [Actinoplanes lutulentus]MBB2943795.1 AcrR family transcriptional regulator [Actinoplanes lutulentus]RAK29337.1 TetR family transcriptional regulator [Actinoplanes lutulentus]